MTAEDQVRAYEEAMGKPPPPPADHPLAWQWEWRPNPANRRALHAALEAPRTASRATT